ncbi:hypothetical protein [Ferrovibrio sp.]|uniref:hypothetical protein n=1 Tax=Ferrovibrio sp. TaxID=1917215 RepID=UPI00311E758C
MFSNVITLFSRARPGMSCGASRSGFFPDALRAAWPHDTAKRAARVTGRHPRTIENWLAGSEPSLSDIVCLMEANPVIFEAVCRAAGRGDAAQLVVLLAQARQVADAIDTISRRAPAAGHSCLVPPGGVKSAGSHSHGAAE